MIFGNHERRKGDIVTIARWDEQALMTTAWRFNIRPISGHQRRKACEAMACMQFVVADIDYYHRKMKLAVLFEHRKTGALSPAKHKDNFTVVELDETNLIRVGRLS